MDKVKELIRQYRLFLIFAVIFGIVAIISPETGKSASASILGSLKEMAGLLPPIFILIGLVDVWIPREVMIKLMGENAGLKGILIAFAFGSFAAGPLYVAFPIAVMLKEKGCSFRNMMVFLGAWSTTKLPMLLYEVSFMGVKYTLMRLVCNIIGIIIIASAMNGILRKEVKAD